MRLLDRRADDLHRYAAQHGPGARRGVLPAGSGPLHHPERVQWLPADAAAVAHSAQGRHAASDGDGLGAATSDHLGGGAPRCAGLPFLRGVDHAARGRDERAGAGANDGYTQQCGDQRCPRKRGGHTHRERDLVPNAKRGAHGGIWILQLHLHYNRDRYSGGVPACGLRNQRVPVCHNRACGHCNGPVERLEPHVSAGGQHYQSGPAPPSVRSFWKLQFRREPRHGCCSERCHFDASDTPAVYQRTAHGEPREQLGPWRLQLHDTSWNSLCQCQHSRLRCGPSHRGL
mmetsp:Transcript_22652/g.68167  ORF Transcript_22652/g.68167 Transcript_22652/m.68167 type:complete len:287 (+) Transcript_22652:326-1186(+)